MVEVFKTNVQHAQHARMLVHHLHESFGHYCVNFDLDDCDRILRVQCPCGAVENDAVIEVLRDFGFTAEVLPDSPSVESRMSLLRSASLYFYQSYNPQ